MEPVLTLLAGYWIFRGLEALARADEQSTQPRYTPSPVRSLTESAPTIPTVAGKPLREPSATRYADARSLFAGEYVSFTRLDTFAKCRHKFKLTYLEGFRHEDRDLSRQARSGNEFHALCEDLFGSYTNQSVADALADPRAARDDRVKLILDAVPGDSEILATELELRFRAGGREFLGYVDLVVEMPDSTVALIDLKTGYTNPRYPPSRMQLDIYSIPELLLRPERKVRLAFVLVDAQRCDAWTNGPENRDDVIKYIREKIVEVEQESVFKPRPSGLCPYCHVRDLCHAEGGGESVYRKFARDG